MLGYSAAEIVVVAVVLVAAATDIRSRRIPNWLSLAGVCAGLLVNGFVSGLHGIEISVLGMLLGFGAYFVLYSLHAMGAGDVKLMAAVGAILGPGHWFAVFLATAIAGGVFAVVLMVWKGRVLETLWNSIFIASELVHFRAPHKRRGDLDVKNPNAIKMPHGVAIAAGTIACLLLAII